mmetsp:Transcript_38761/g.76811  ORF Transcript_38761/g.76811 Transcript_38761/m.76811 type:complete len:133 (-) Transcript_38761:134-532(-)
MTKMQLTSKPGSRKFPSCLHQLQSPRGQQKVHRSTTLRRSLSHSTPMKHVSLKSGAGNRTTPSSRNPDILWKRNAGIMEDKAPSKPLEEDRLFAFQLSNELFMHEACYRWDCTSKEVLGSGVCIFQSGWHWH